VAGIPIKGIGEDRDGSGQVSRGQPGTVLSNIYGRGWPGEGSGTGARASLVGPKRTPVVVSFGTGSISQRLSFPSRHGGRNPVCRQPISEDLRSGFPLSRE